MRKCPLIVTMSNVSLENVKSLVRFWFCLFKLSVFLIVSNISFDFLLFIS